MINRNGCLNYKPIRSPINYFGGKNRLLKDFLKYVPLDTTKIISPFLGGGAIELNLRLLGMEVIASDLDQSLVNFWRYFLYDPTTVIQNSKCLLSRSNRADMKDKKEDWFAKKQYESLYDACMFYLYNRLSFAGRMEKYFVRDFHVINNDYYIVSKRKKNLCVKRLFAFD